MIPNFPHSCCFIQALPAFRCEQKTGNDFKSQTWKTGNRWDKTPLPGSVTPSNPSAAVKRKFFAPGPRKKSQKGSNSQRILTVWSGIIPGRSKGEIPGAAKEELPPHPKAPSVSVGKSSVPCAGELWDPQAPPAGIGIGEAGQTQRILGLGFIRGPIPAVFAGILWEQTGWDLLARDLLPEAFI